MRIGIIGTRGIPNAYGGFEQCADYLSAGLAAKGHEVYVYCSSAHPYNSIEYGKVRLIRCYDPEPRIGTAGQFIYDLNCLRDARKRKFHVVLQLGYTSNAVWYRLWPKCANVVNMDGLEWKRSKYSNPVKHFLRWSEAIAVKHADSLVADSPGIKDYLFTKYGVEASFIPYGAEVTEDSHEAVSGFPPSGEYDLLIARMEPENNPEMIIKSFLASASTVQLIVVGNLKNRYGKLLFKKFSGESRVRFTGPLFDKSVLDRLRANARYYYHGHSVGGTNPSLLEAMAAGAFILAHDNVFNRYVLHNNAGYFKDMRSLTELINNFNNPETRNKFTLNNREAILKSYSWTDIISRYEDVLIRSYYNRSK